MAINGAINEFCYKVFIPDTTVRGKNSIPNIKIVIEDKARFVKITGEIIEKKAADQEIKRVEIDEEGAKQKNGSTGHFFSTLDCTAVFCGQFDKTWGKKCTLVWKIEPAQLTERRNTN